jgi:hypothetical protein
VMKAFKKDVDVPCARMRFVALSRRHINFHRCPSLVLTIMHMRRRDGAQRERCC